MCVHRVFCLMKFSIEIFFDYFMRTKSNYSLPWVAYKKDSDCRALSLKKKQQRVQRDFVSMHSPPPPPQHKKKINRFTAEFITNLYILTQILHACYEFGFSRQFNDIIRVLLFGFEKSNIFKNCYCNLYLLHHTVQYLAIIQYAKWRPCH